MNEEQRTLLKVFVGNEDDIYALVCKNRSCPGCVSKWKFRFERHLSFFTKYRPEANSWEDITSFGLGPRKGICVVAKDNFIYFLGGCVRTSLKLRSEDDLTNADRFDLKTNTWEKIADLQEPRSRASGAVAYGKLFIDAGPLSGMTESKFQVYNETTNEWHLVGTGKIALSFSGWTCADGKLYLLITYLSRRVKKNGMIACYDPDKDRWKEVTEMPLKMFSCRYFSVRVFMARDLPDQTPSTPTVPTGKVAKQKCAIM